ncbi:hypothetical protein CSB37_03330 [bacterium DOLZORAL124_38_8]|nr:MAG: hypothetical protein CSB37_03330 [bacterium DOLZORAL124_38_8]
MKIRTYNHQNRRRRVPRSNNIGERIWTFLLTSSWKMKILQGMLVGFIGVILYACLFLPSVKDAAQLQFAESTIIYDRGALDPDNSPNDHILYVIHGDENREFVPLEQISEHIKNATIAVEDEDFYKWYHFGFDIPALVKAVLSQLGIGPARGGSTITQQLVKNTFLNSSKTFSRKFNELLLAIKMELTYSKDEILEMYLNKIPYGSNSNGIEAASRRFFGKSSRDLTLAEAAILAGLPNRPTFFSPYGSHRDQLMGYEVCGTEKIVYGRVESLSESDTEKKSTKEAVPTAHCQIKLGRKDLVLNSMEKLEMATKEAVQKAKEEAKTIEFKQNKTDIKAPHFVFYIRQQLEEKYGKEFLQNGGLRIFTTLDRTLQDIAEETIQIKSPLYKRQWNASNVALAAINPQNGEILAYVGGKDYFDSENDGQVDVLQSFRQPGSSFKPFTFAAAFDKGYTPSTPIFDVETDFGGGYRPQNFDGNFAGLVSAREALNRSLNVPAVKFAHLATPQGVIDTAKNAGIELRGNAKGLGVSIGVGTAEVKILSHINAYQVFVNNGKYYKPTSILEIRSSNGKILERAQKPEPNLGISETSTALVRNILTDESTRPTTDDFDWNKLLQLKDYDNGSKTGTSNIINKKTEDIAPGDSWTVGFTPHLVAGVWVGNNNNNPMNPGATGMTVAAPIWRAFMEKAHAKMQQDFIEKQGGTAKQFTQKKYPKPTSLITKKINKVTGRIASEFTPVELAKDEVFSNQNVPIEFDNFATLSTDQQKKYFHSLLPNKPNWEAPVQNWLSNRDNALFTMLGIKKKELLEELELMYGNPNVVVPNINKISLITGKELVKILSPIKNAEIPVNSQFEVGLGINSSRIKIKEVTVQFGGIETKLKSPYITTFSTKKMAKGRKTIHITVTDQQGNVLEKEQAITLVKEPFGYSKTPIISNITVVPGGANMQIMYGARVTPPDNIKLLIQNEKGDIIKQQTVIRPPKTTNFFVPKTSERLSIKVFSTYGTESKLTDKKTYRF